MNRFITFIILISLLIFSNACREDDEVNWHTEYKFPAGKAGFSLQDLFNEGVIITDEDGNYTLFFQHQLYAAKSDSLIKIPEEERSRTITLQSITLGNQSFVNYVSLGSIASEMGPAGLYIISQHGQDAQVPAFNNISGSTQIDAGTYLETATFREGKMDVEITNGLPVSLTDIEFRLENASDNSLIFQEFIQEIEPNASFLETYALDGLTMEGVLNAVIVNMNTPGSGSDEVPIDTGDAVEVKITAYDLDVHSATAVFPAQNLYEAQEEIVYDMGEAGITEMKIKSGYIQIIAYSTVGDTVYVEYDVPGAIKNNMHLSVRDLIPPSLNNQVSFIEERVHLDDYVIDYTGVNQDTVNTFYNDLVVRIDSTGELVHISLDDSFRIVYGVYETVPKYAYGYLGSYQYEHTQNGQNIQFFEHITDGTFNPESFQARFIIRNGVGADASIKLDHISGKNKLNNQTIDLQASDLFQNIHLPPANEQPFEPSVTIITLDKDNSNLIDFINHLPHTIDYQLGVHLNPDGFTGSFDNFIFEESEVEVDLEFEMPVKFSAENLTWEYLMPLENIGTGNGSNQIESAELTFNFKNELPVRVSFQLYILDKDEKVIDSLITKDKVELQAADVNPANGMLIKSYTAQKKVKLNTGQINALAQNPFIKVKAVLNTASYENDVKPALNPSHRIEVDAEISIEYKHRSNVTN
jgi:hypothetical protein